MGVKPPVCHTWGKHFAQGDLACDQPPTAQFSPWKEVELISTFLCSGDIINKGEFKKKYCMPGNGGVCL